MRLTLSFLLFLWLTFFVSSCHKKEDTPIYSCDGSRTVIDTLVNKSGSLLFDSMHNVYMVRLVPVGTIDNVDIIYFMQYTGRIA